MSASYVDRLLMRFDDVFHDREPESGSTLFTGAALIHPVEAFENTREMARLDANARIGDLDEDVLVHVVKTD